ncbi:hypothetical protein [Halomonas sp. OfavH-34-E]|uniref:hypothetical protein n=1 Tax=Halomonas sp. OfavH-34-E TaxID=2954491 RepID=UPI00209821BE|nr:hypothetical protein [Halomonas sp. OfavH-34-E]MCO7216515.1 hypothetical protein [Halomonas sp. OfavH-34-E]
MAYESVEDANQQTLETLTELERRARELVNILKGGIDVGQSGTLGDLALLDTLSASPVGNAAMLRSNIGLGTAATASVGTGANDVPKTSQADARYARLSAANNFDTMPAVAGSPLIESDSNSNGGWVRFADGTQICSRIATGRDIDISNTAGAIYRTPSQGTWNFPASFIDEPAGDVTATGSGSLFWSSVTTSNGSGARMDFYYVSYSSGVRESCVERFFAKGRWKA